MVFSHSSKEEGEESEAEVRRACCLRLVRRFLEMEEEEREAELSERVDWK